MTRTGFKTGGTVPIFRPSSKQNGAVPSLSSSGTGSYVRIPFVLLLAGLCLATTIGCDKSEQIARYTVERLPPFEPPQTASPRDAQGQPPQPAGEPTDRMLGAIVPRGTQGWFFKLTGPKDAVAAQADTFAALVKSVRFSADGKPKWTLPPDWEERPGGDIRYATLVIPGDDKPLEVSVTVLPNPGNDEQGYVLLNVNRWRGQLGMAPIAKEQLTGESTSIPLEGATATLVNLLGTATPSTGRGPFQSGARDGK
jgi:hypothetical protein